MSTRSHRAQLAADWLVISLNLLAIGCGPSTPQPASPLDAPAHLCAGQDESDCWSPQQVEEALSAPSLEILGVDDPPTGIQGAHVLTLRSTSGDQRRVFRAKWRPQSAATHASRPRRELVAYFVQQLFLEPEDYVVPPVQARCFPLDQYHEQVDPEAEASFPQVDCVFGYLSYWLEDVKPLDGVDWLKPERGPFDPDLFQSHPPYRRALSNLNLLTFLIDHDDSHSNQFVVRDSWQQPTIYSVDNSMSFLAGTNPNLDEEQDWSNLQIAISSDVVDRGVSISHADIERIVHMQALRIEERQLRVSDRSPPPGVPASDDGLRVDGDMVLLGLARAELEFLARRIELLKRMRAQGRFRESSP